MSRIDAVNARAYAHLYVCALCNTRQASRHARTACRANRATAAAVAVAAGTAVPRDFRNHTGTFPRSVYAVSWRTRFLACALRVHQERRGGKAGADASYSTTCASPRRPYDARRRPSTPVIRNSVHHETLSLLHNRTERCLARHRVLNITKGSFYDPLNISY